MSLLQEECDSQAGKVFKEFRKKRNLKAKIDIVRDSTYGSASLSSAASMTSSFSSESASGQPKLEARDLDHILEEMTLLQARSEMYFKFIRKKAGNDIDISTQEESERSDKKSVMEKKILASGLCQSIQEILSEYILLEDYYMKQNIRKATDQHVHTLNTISDGSNQDGDNSEKLLDEVFFIVKQCISRATGCGNVDGLCAVANNAASILEADFAGLLQNQLKMGYPSGYLGMTMNVIQTSLHHGYRKAAAQVGDSERQKIIFLVNKTINQSKPS